MSEKNKPNKVEVYEPKVEPRVLKIRIPSAKFWSAASLPLSILAAGLLIGGSLLGAGNVIKDGIKNSGLISSTAGTSAGITTTPTPTNATVALGSMVKRGSDNAKIAIVEFSDFECPFCGQYFTDAGKNIMSDYVDTGKINLYYRHLPLSIHPHARELAEAAVCANDQGKFWQYHDDVFTKIVANNRTVPNGLIQTVSNDVGIDSAKLTDCINSKKDSSIIDTDSKDATAAGIDGTPGFVIGIMKDGKVQNGTIISGAQPYAQFKQIIDSYLNS